MGNIFAGRQQTTRKTHSTVPVPQPTKKNSVYYTSKINGILTIKEENEKKAAALVADYLKNKTETILDEITLMKDLNMLLEGFSIEEKNRILSRALINALVTIA